jgi:predicted anti-sigma-YlaC factor YlaD
MNACTSHREALGALAAAGGSAEPDPKLAAHLAACADCRKLTGEMGIVVRGLAHPPRAPPEAALSPKVLRTVATTVRVSPRRGGHETRVVGVLAGLTVVIAALMWKPVNDIGGTRTGTMVISKVDPRQVARGREPRFGDYLSALQRSPEAFDALVDAESATTPAGTGEIVVTLRAGSRFE